MTSLGIVKKVTSATPLDKTTNKQIGNYAHFVEYGSASKEVLKILIPDNVMPYFEKVRVGDVCYIECSFIAYKDYQVGIMLKKITTITKD